MTAPLDVPLDLAVVGLNHKTAPLSVRERAIVRPDELPSVLSHLRRHAAEALLLSTCNRTEAYLAGVDGEPLSAFEGAWGHALREHLYVYRGEEAARHLYGVTAGLDSLVVGETQIQGQVKRAWQDAHAHGDTAALLNKVAQGALAAGKKVRHLTGIGDKATSISGAAVELATNALGDLTDRHALVLGAGETAELTLTHLRAAGVRRITVVNRTVERARLLAEKLGGVACAAEYLHEVLPAADVVIASSSAPHYVLGPERVREALIPRPERSMFLIDISVPRIVDPLVGEVPGAHLYNLDDLTRIVAGNLAERSALVPQAEGIIEAELQNLLHWNTFRVARQREALATACD